MITGITISRAFENQQTIHIALNHKLSRAKRLYISLFGLFLNLLIINDLVRIFISSNGSSVALVQYVTYSFILLFSLIYLVFSKDQRKSRVPIVLFLLVLGLITVLSIFRLNALQFFVENYFTVLFSRCLPAFLLFMFIDDESAEGLINNLTKYRFLWLAYSALGVIFISRLSDLATSYAGNYGFNLLLPFGIAFYLFLRKCRELHITEKIKKKKRRLIKFDIWKWLIYSVFFLVFIAMKGSRSAFLCAFAFIPIAFFFSGLVSKKGRQLLFLLLLVVGILGIVFFKQIVELLVKMFPNSRTILLLVDGFSADSGRFAIWKYFIDDLNTKPFIFRGLFADRYSYSAYIKRPLDPTNYPHDFFVEVLYQFGYVFGGILLLLLLVLVIRTAIVLNNKRFQNCSLSFLFWFFFVASIIRLTITSSYVTTFEFYAFLAIAFKINVLSKQKTSTLVIKL